MGPRGRNNKFNIANMILEAKGIDFDNEAAGQRFGEKYSGQLIGHAESNRESWRPTEDNVLHNLAKKKQLVEYERFIKWAIECHGSLLRCKDDSGRTPLHVALYKNNHKFVGLVLKHASPEHINQQDNTKYSCVHYAILYKSPFTEAMITKFQHLSRTASAHGTMNATDSMNHVYSDKIDDVFTVKCGDGHCGTPLHAAVAIFEDDSDEDNRDSETETETENSQEDSYDVKNDTGVVEMDFTERTDKAVDVPDKTPANIGAPRQPVPTGNSTEANSSTKPLKFDAQSIVRKLIEANRWVLVDHKDKNGETPFQSRLSHLQNRLKGSPDVNGKSLPSSNTGINSVVVSEDERHEIIEGDPILNNMREYILSTFNRRDAMKALYKVGDERVFEFDLSGLSYSKINKEFLNGLRFLRFEGQLKYVALPRLVVEDDEGFDFSENTAGDPMENTEQNQGSKVKGKGIQHMCTIFKWLKDHHIKSVMKITVIDDTEPSHSDEAIETCVENLDVRIWNWYKIDLCCNVIINYAPNVHDVTLYSSGNNAVLVGWSSPTGLATLKQLKNLHIYVQEGLETLKRVQSNMEIFTSELRKYNPNINCTWEIRKQSSNSNSVFTERNAGQPTESRWMKAMKDFAEFLRRAKPSNLVQPVKIAVIDDGIDTSLDVFTNKIQGGESFYRLDELSTRRTAYYVPSGPHGTLMAQLICEVCPVVKLYIAQLEILHGHGSQRSFTAESATEAVLWAIDQGVDIISMSWSIKSSGTFEDLENALSKAEKARIIMLCSSIDEGATATDDTYPGREKNCIKIGASTGSGGRLSWVSEGNSHFLVPGDALQPAIAPNSWGHPHLGSVGSSVATALAAGLAGVLLYCDRLINEPADKPTTGSAVPNEGLKNSDSAKQPAKAIEDLRQKGKMSEVFKRLAMATEKNKFLQVWNYLPTDSESLVWNKTSHPEDTKKTQLQLERFMGQLHIKPEPQQSSV